MIVIVIMVVVVVVVVVVVMVMVVVVGVALLVVVATVVTGIRNTPSVPSSTMRNYIPKRLFLRTRTHYAPELRT